jgi:hypothetical protein
MKPINQQSIPIILIVIIIFTITAGLLIISHSSLIPYNVRELVIKDSPIISSFLFSLFVCWSFGGAVWIAHLFSKTGRKTLFFILSGICHGCVAWILLRSAVPMESIHDIVGAPILFWPLEFEIIGRFLALYFMVTFTAALSALIGLRFFMGNKNSAPLKCLAYGIAFCFISHFIVVAKASTDNLTELMAAGGTLFSSFLLGLFLLVLFSVATFFAIMTATHKYNLKNIAIPAFFLSFPFAFLLLYSASAKSIVKYKQNFSALQFLLSPDRKHLVEMPELLIRYAIAHAGIVLLIALIQIPFWIWLSKIQLTTHQ